MAGFCDYLKEITAKCDTCYENGIGACHISLGVQEYYAKFGITDTIQIIRHNHKLSVETDIEVRYKTKNPYGRFAGKGAEFAIEEAQKRKEIRDYLQPKLPPGVTLQHSHLHYFPDKHDPEVVALHIHAHKTVEDLDEAKHIVGELAKVVNPREIEEAMK